MSGMRLAVLVALVSLLLVPSIALAQSFPQLPCRFYGGVLLDGAPVPNGTVVTATIEGDEYVTTTPVVVDGALPYGNSTYALWIKPPEGTFYDEGSPIAFTVGGYVADQQATWQSGSNIVFNITALRAPLLTPAPSPTPLPSPTETPPLPSPSPEATPAPTVAPPATPTPTPPPPTLNIGRLVGLIIFGIVDLILVLVLVYVVWKLLSRRRSPAEPQPPEPPDRTTGRPPTK